MVMCEKWILHDLDVDHLSKIRSKDGKKISLKKHVRPLHQKTKMRKQYNGEFKTPNFLQVRKKNQKKKKEKKKNGEIGGPHFSIPLRK